MTLDIETTASCDNDGTATVTVTGGVEPLSYLWSPIPQTTATATGLSEGTYIVQVTDADSNVAFATATIVSGLQNFLIAANCCLAELGNQWVIERSYGHQETCQEKVELLKHWISILSCYPRCTEEVQAFADVLFETALFDTFNISFFDHDNYYVNNTPNTPIADIVEGINAVTPQVITASLVGGSTIRTTYVAGGAANNGRTWSVGYQLGAITGVFAGGDTNYIPCDPVQSCITEEEKCTLINKIRGLCPQCN